MKRLGDRPVLGWLISSSQRVPSLAEVVVATTQESQDDSIEEFCKASGVHCVRGPTEDVLGRFDLAAAETRADVVVRLTADDPFKDPRLIELVTHAALSMPDVDFVTNAADSGFPIGMGAEAVTRPTLRRLSNLQRSNEDREHVTTALYRPGGRYKGLYLRHSPSMERHAFTIDTAEDFKFHELLLERLDERKWPWAWQDLVRASEDLGV